MDPVVVIGAGISGVSCARTLADAGIDAVMFDRGRRIGGRMAAKTINGRPVDIGASYFTVSDPEFAAVVNDWRDRGLARPWTDTFQVFQAGEDLRSSRGPQRWGATGGLPTLVEDLASGLVIDQHQVREVKSGEDGSRLLVDDRPASAVILAMPEPQARRLLHADFQTEIDLLDRPFEPVLALSAGWPERTWAADLDGVFVNGDEHLGWVADDGRRRGDDASVLVAHSTAELARRHLQNPADAEQPMVDSLLRILDITEQPSWTQVHRWSFAHPSEPRGDSFHWGESGIGVCGDGWSDKPRVEAAFLSGAALGRALLEQL